MVTPTDRIDVRAALIAGPKPVVPRGLLWAIFLGLILLALYAVVALGIQTVKDGSLDVTGLATTVLLFSLAANRWTDLQRRRR